MPPAPDRRLGTRQGTELAGPGAVGPGTGLVVEVVDVGPEVEVGPGVPGVVPDGALGGVVDVVVDGAVDGTGCVVVVAGRFGPVVGVGTRAGAGAGGAVGPYTRAGAGAGLTRL